MQIECCDQTWAVGSIGDEALVCPLCGKDLLKDALAEGGIFFQIDEDDIPI